MKIEGHEVHVCTVCFADSANHDSECPCGCASYLSPLCCPGCDCRSYEEAHEEQ